MGAEKFKFFRAGGVDQVQIRTGKDLVNLKELDQKLWVALSCPVVGLQFDERTLTLIDSEKDGRVHAPELLGAIGWAAGLLTDVEALGRPSEPLALDSIRTDSDEGKLLSQTAQALLESLGKADATTISVEDTQKALDTFRQQPRNGDGILPLNALSEPLHKAVGEAILATLTEPKKDRSGDNGFDRADLVAFFTAVKERLAWLQAGQEPAILVLGEKTALAHGALTKIAAKAEDFFTRVHVVSFDSRATVAMNREESTFLALGQKDLSRAAPELRDLPLATIAPGALLPLVGGLNPAWVEAIFAFNEQTVRPLIGERTALSEIEFRTLTTRLAPYADWLAKEPPSPSSVKASPELEAWVKAGAEAQLLDIVQKDEDASARWGAIETVEKLVRFKRDLLNLANNFVSFRDFYQPGKRAIFQIGTLYIDQRALELVLRVNDPAKHATLAPLSATYLLYCDAKAAGGKTMSIVAGVTNGDVDNLMVGRNGLFYDRSGQDWDATITRIVDNPISVRQAFWSPYKKIIRIIEEQVNKRAAAAASKSDEKLVAHTTAAEAAVADGAKPTAPEPPKKLDIGVLAAIGVAVGGITAALGAFLQAFLGLGIWMPLGVLGLLFLISGPSMAIAWLKLRRRNIGPLLDANGWAVNVLPKINMPLGQSLTKLAKWPKGATRDLVDPFAEKKAPWKTYIFLLVLLGLAVLWLFGSLDRFLPLKVRKSVVLPHFGTQVEPTPLPAAAPKAPSLAPTPKP